MVDCGFCINFLSLVYIVLSILRPITMPIFLYKELHEIHELHKNYFLEIIIGFSIFYSFIVVIIMIFVISRDYCGPPNKIQLKDLIWSVSIMYIFDAIIFTFFKNITGIGICFLGLMIFSDIILFAITICFAFKY